MTMSFVPIAKRGSRFDAESIRAGLKELRYAAHRLWTSVSRTAWELTALFSFWRDRNVVNVLGKSFMHNSPC